MFFYKTQAFPYILFLSLFLSGCSIYEQAFDCEAGKGVGCKSISEVNGLIDQNKLDSTLEGEMTASGKPDFQGCKEDLESLPALPVSITEMPIDGAFVKRAREETLRIWIAPFEDKSGDFQGESFVHTVIAPGRWVTSYEDNS